MSRKGTPRFCIIGGNSAIGAALEASLRRRGFKVQSSTRRKALDFGTQFHLDLRYELSDILIPNCDVLVLAASVTRLSECRSNPEAALRINVRAQLELAKWAANQGAFVVFLSTNQVFDGTKTMVFPDEPLAPRSIYGKLKADAESGLLQLGEGVAIIRLGKVIGGHLRLFQTWRRNLLCGNSIEAFYDLVMAPVSLAKVAFAIERIGVMRASGVWHLSGHEEINYADAARHLAFRLGADEFLIRDASAAHFGIPEEERPMHAALASDAAQTMTGICIGDARTELDIGLGFSGLSQPDDHSIS